jgi:hypothetical protein
MIIDTLRFIAYGGISAISLIISSATIAFTAANIYDIHYKQAAR